MSLRVAVFAAIAFLAGAVLAVAIDLASYAGWDYPTLQAWTLVPQSISCAGMVFIGRRQRSKSFYILAAIIGLIVIEEAFHVLNPVAAWLGRVASWVLVYGLVALVGLVGLALSHWHGSSDERPVIRNIGAGLLAAGFFGGPISVVSSAVRPTQVWLFVEEFGEALVFMAVGGYVVGLVVSLRASSWPRSFRPTHP